MNHTLGAKWLLPVVVALGSACGEPGAYKLVNVPYCQVPEGAARNGFTEGLSWLYTAGDMRGSGPIVGDWPKLGLGVADSVSTKQAVLAVVSCPRVAGQGGITTSSSNPKTLADGLTAAAVPAVCAGQEVLFHGTLTATDDPAAKAKGYDGVLRFPDIAATCAVGTLARTTSADIEQRPK